MTEGLEEYVKVKLSDLQQREDFNPVVNLSTELAIENKARKKKTRGYLPTQVKGPIGLKVDKPVFYSRRQFIDKVNSFLTLLEIDTVLFPSVTPNSVKEGVFDNIRRIKGGLTELRTRLFNLNDFINIDLIQMRNIQRAHEYLERKKITSNMMFTEANSATKSDTIRFPPSLNTIQSCDTDGTPLIRPSTSSELAIHSTFSWPSFIPYERVPSHSTDSLITPPSSEINPLRSHSVTSTQRNISNVPITGVITQSSSNVPITGIATQNYITPSLKGGPYKRSKVLKEEEIDIETIEIDDDPIDLSKYEKVDF